MTPTRKEQWKQVEEHLREALKIMREMQREEGQGDRINAHRVFTSLDSAINNIPRLPKPLDSGEWT